MKIKQLNLIAFGPFKNYELNLGENMFNLIYGLNEAGKTTVLRAIRDFFYGIPQRSPDAYLHQAAELRIEAALEARNGGELKLCRRKGRKNTLLDEKARPVDESILQQFLGAINRESFSLMFGLDHLSLRKGGEDLLHGQGSLGEALFEAASGIGSLRELFKELDQEAAALFKPSGSRPPINVQAGRYSDIKQKISRLSLAPREWAKLKERYLEQKKRVEQQREEETALIKARNRLERLKKTLPLVARWDKDLSEIERYKDIPILPPHFKEKFFELTGIRQTAVQTREQARKEKIALQEEIKQIVVPEKLLEYSEDIAAMQESLETYRRFIRDIPSRKGEISILQHETLTLLHHLDPSLNTLEEGESLRLPLALVMEIKNLAGDYPLLLQHHTATIDQVNELQRSLKKLAAEKKKIGPWKDVEGLNRAINRARKKGNLEEDLRKAQACSEFLRQRLTNSLNSLGLWKGSLEQLPQLALPLVETVRLFETRFKDIKEQLLPVKNKIAELEEKSANYIHRLAAEETAGELLTEEKLDEARKHRQYGWYLVRQAWLEGRRDLEKERSFHAGEQLHLAYESSVSRADEIADTLRREAGRAERITLLQAGIREFREETKKLAATQQEIDRNRQVLEQEWRTTWQKTGIMPLTPTEMLSWLANFQEIISLYDEANEQIDLEKELMALIGIHKKDICRELQRVGESGTEDTESLDMLIDRAVDIYEKHRTKIGRLQSIDEMYKSTKENLDRALQQKNVAEETLAGRQKKWYRALEKAGLSRDTAVETIAAYLDRQEEFFVQKGELARSQAEMNKMLQYVLDFETRLRALRLKLDTEGIDMTPEIPADRVASQLQTRVIKARRDADKKENLHVQLHKVKTTYKKSTELIDETGPALAELMREARCRKERELPEVIEKAELLGKLKENVNNLEKQLLSLGDGLSLEEIRAETKGVNGDALPAEREEIERMLEKNRLAQDELNRLFGVTEGEYREKVEGTSTEALEAAEEAQSVLAELRFSTEQYLRLRLASLVLRRSIERYREENQSPVLTKAGKLFARLTGGSFCGLNIDFDEKDNPVLLGLRSSLENVTVDGMSDGTLDQLYLSLRLASLERYLHQNEPLPFILDDLLVNFDDVRAAETLKVLGEFSKKTQVLFFTHHQHFVDMAGKTIPHCKIISLS